MWGRTRCVPSSVRGHSGVVEPSEEIRRVIPQWKSAMADRDDDSGLARLSQHPGALMIGSDRAEWWYGEAIHAIWARQLEEVGAPISADEIEAWEEGTVGWASVKETI